MNTKPRAGLLQRWSVVQEELIPGLGREVEGLTPKLEKLIHTLEWARIEDFVPAWQGIGRPPKDRCALANALRSIHSGHPMCVSITHILPPMARDLRATSGWRHGGAD